MEGSEESGMGFFRRLAQAVRRRGGPPADQAFSVSEPPSALHSAGVLTITPWPLHSFRPLQSFLEVAHRLSPLQLLAP